MSTSSARINFRLKKYADRPEVKRKVKKWQLARLSRAGAYARGAMKKQIRHRPKGKRARTVTFMPDPMELPPKWKGGLRPITVYLPADGPAVYARSGRKAYWKFAIRARLEIAKRNKGKGEGKPPRRGPTDDLRQHIYFQIDTKKPSVVIGPEKLPRKYPLVNRKTVPELLNKGGIEMLLGERVKYGPRPYVETILKPAIKALKGQIKKYPVGKRI